MTEARPRIAVATCMRNEGPFILEWVAYYRALGFDEILVLTNDCDDGSDKMLDRLDAMGQLTHIDNPAMDDLPPLARGIKRAFAHPKVKSCDWLLLCDADEFPCITHGEGKIHDLVAAMPGHTDCIALHWKAFGTSGLTDFPFEENVLEVNTMAQAAPDIGGFHKSMFRPNKFADAIDHMPKAPYGPVVLRNGAGTVMNARAVRAGFAKFRGADPAHVNFDGACMHHYAIRADDVFVMKNDRGDGRFASHTKYYRNSGFYDRFNKNEVEDRTIARHIPDVVRRKQDYLKDQTLADLHRLGIDTFLKRKAEILTEDQLAAWTRKPKT